MTCAITMICRQRGQDRVSLTPFTANQPMPADTSLHQVRECKFYSDGATPLSSSPATEEMKISRSRRTRIMHRTARLATR
jgi:hypothetical protein